MKVSGRELVTTASLGSDGKLPLVFTPRSDGIDLVEWARDQRQQLEEQLLRHGALLFRGFQLSGAGSFEAFAQAISPQLLDYQERAAPRHEVGRRIYTSTEFPPDQEIPLHHEMSYSHNWPTKIWFYCAQPAGEGGRTPIASDREVIDCIDPQIKEIFGRKKVMYVRNYGEGVDLPWQEVFQTDDRAAVEAYCHRARMEVEWRDKDRLRTRAVRQAMVTHPRTGETVWFNHAHLFHVSSLEGSVREALLSEFADDELPRNAFFGDGTAIDPDMLEAIRRTYRAAAVSFAWQPDDILMVDNFLVSHGREPFRGPRRILVAMAELYTNPDL